MVLSPPQMYRMPGSTSSRSVSACARSVTGPDSASAATSLTQSPTTGMVLPLPTDVRISPSSPESQKPEPLPFLTGTSSQPSPSMS